MLTQTDIEMVTAWRRRFSEKTAHDYRTDILEFFSHVRKPIDVVRTTDIRAYVGKITDSQAPAVQRRSVAAIKSLFHYLNEIGYLDNDPAATVRNLCPEPPREPVALSEQTIMQLLENALNDRDYIIIALAYYALGRQS